MNGKQRKRQRGRELHMYIVQESVPKKNIEYVNGEYFERIIRDYRRSLNEKEWQVHQNSHKKKSVPSALQKYAVYDKILIIKNC